MGDPVTSAGSGPPANQTTNASQSGAASPADPKFDEALKQESLCPEGLSRRPPDGCTYLRNPSQPSKPADLWHVPQDILNRSLKPTNDPNIDYKKSIPAERDPNPLAGAKPPDRAPSHDSGLSKNAHIIMVPMVGTPREPSPDQTPYQPPR